MGDVLIAGLMIGDCSDRLCVRASRTWDFCDLQDETKLLHSDLVLIDEEGNSAHAQIYPPLTEKFKPLIKEGNVYNLSFVQIKKANRMYKPVENDIMIIFTRWTTVEEVIQIPPAFPEFTYSLTPIEKIPSLVDNREYFTDVIGAITMISDTSPLRRQLTRTVTIRDASNTSLDVVLWGERATLFPAEQLHRDGQNSPQIVIFVGTLVKNYAGNISLSGGSPCKWYINPKVLEAENLKSSMENMHHPITIARQATYNEPKVSAAEHKKISDIKYLHPFKNKKVEWLVTVKIMRIDKSWWYNSCKKCLKTTKAHGSTYKCSSPTCNNIGAPNPRYKLAVTAGDETGDTEFVMFERIAQRLIKRTAETLVANNPPGFIPDEITRLLGKVFTFNVSFTDNTISSGNVSFQVNTIIAELDDGTPLPMTPIESQSSSAILSQEAGGSMQVTPIKDTTLTSPSPATEQELATTPQSNKNIEGNKAVMGPALGVLPTYSMVETQQSATKKRARASPSKKTGKKLFTDEDARNENKGGSAGATAKPRLDEGDA